MHYVYLIRSISHPNQTYIGNTINLKQHLETHNSGRSIYTQTYWPWELVLFLGFKNKLKATAFEKYLNSRHKNKKLLRFLRPRFPLLNFNIFVGDCAMVFCLFQQSF